MVLRYLASDEPCRETPDGVPEGAVVHERTEGATEGSFKPPVENFEPKNEIGYLHGNPFWNGYFTVHGMPLP